MDIFSYSVDLLFSVGSILKPCSSQTSGALVDHVSHASVEYLL
jgi:hypothetical protein